MKKLLFLIMCLGMSSNVFSVSPRVVKEAVEQLHNVTAATRNVAFGRMWSLFAPLGRPVRELPHGEPPVLFVEGPREALADVARLSGERLPRGYDEFVSVGVSEASVKNCLDDLASCPSQTIKAVHAAMGGDTRALRELLIEGLDDRGDFKHVQLAAYLSGDVKTVKLVEEGAVADINRINDVIADPEAYESSKIYGEISELLHIKRFRYEDIIFFMKNHDYLHFDDNLKTILKSLPEFEDMVKYTESRRILSVTDEYNDIPSYIIEII